MSTARAELDYLHARDNTRIGHLPGRYGLPLLGRTFGFIVEPFAVLDSIYREYGPVSRISLTFQKMVLARSEERRVGKERRGWRGVEPREGKDERKTARMA